MNLLISPIHLPRIEAFFDNRQLLFLILQSLCSTTRNFTRGFKYTFNFEPKLKKRQVFDLTGQIDIILNTTFFKVNKAHIRIRDSKDIFLFEEMIQHVHHYSPFIKLPDLHSNLLELDRISIQEFKDLQILLQKKKLYIPQTLRKGSILEDHISDLCIHTWLEGSFSQFKHHLF